MWIRWIRIQIRNTDADIYLADPAVPGLACRDHSVEVGAGAVVHVVPVPLQVQKVLAVVAPVRLKLNQTG